MPVHNTDVARIFTKVADLLEIEGANRFRVRAYRNGAQTVRQLSKNVADMVEDGADLTELDGIGEDLAEYIEEIVDTGSLELLDELESKTPPALADLMHIEGLGPKRVKKLHEALGISSRDDLRTAAEEGKIREVEGFGEKTEQNILDHIEQGAEERTMWAEVEPVAEDLAAYLAESEEVERVEVAGSYRRKKETVGDLDVLALGEEGEPIMEHFVDYEDVDEVLSQGTTKSSVVLKSGLQVDLRVIPSESYGAALVYFTGSKAHNIELRDRALDRDRKLNEYGLFEGEDDRVAGTTEDEVYEALNLDVVPPELREQRGEVEAAAEGSLPDLIELDDLRGNLHSHTTDSDGKASIQEMAEAAIDRGHDYLAITDHSSLVGVVQGLEADDLRDQIDRIRALDEEIDDLKLLAGIEVDILKDGSLDLPDDVLKRLDVCIASVHTSLALSEEKQTERILRAMDNPHVQIVGHPTGRRLGQREPYPVDVPRLIEAAADRDCLLELNAQPERLDLNDTYCKAAKDAGVTIALGADAHTIESLGFLRYGIWQARRGWLEADDVLNTRSWTECAKMLKR